MLGKALYQVVVLGAHGPRMRVAFEDQLRHQLAELGEDVERSLRVLGPDDVNQIVGASPLVVIYFGNDKTTDENVLNDLVARSVPILPVVDDVQNYTEKRLR